jgi:hypothetical protein
MPGANDPTVEDLAREARQCETRGEWAEALDAYEEIERRGKATVEHLASMGVCLLQSRQRQDARRIWLRAYEMNIDFAPVVELLDKNFPGWEKTIAARFAPPKAPPASPPSPSPSPGSPPPPPPPNAGPNDATTVNLTSRTIQPPGQATTQSGGGRPAAAGSQPAARSAEQRRDAADRDEDRRTASLEKSFGRRMPANSADEDESPQERTGSLRPSTRPAPASAAAGAARPAPRAASDAQGPQLPQINWDFVMADALAESGEGTRH